MALGLPTSLVGINLLDSSPVTFDLKDGKNKVVVFMSTQCPCSESHEKLLAKISQEFSDIPFIAIHSNSNEEAGVAQAHFKKARLPFAVMQDNGAKIADEFKALKTPHAFIIDGQGEIIYSGGVTNTANAPTATKQYLKQALLSVKAGKKPDPSEVRTLGCLIARP